MLEKIGLPPKPSLRGNSWVVDASHCQGCSSQFSFINRKHHCRRCGGIFCGNCTRHRIILRGQGDSPVRICDPCKNLEEAARFENRNRYKSKPSKGAPGVASQKEDDMLNDTASKLVVGSSSSSDQASSELEGETPARLREKALEEKKNYRILKDEGKSEDAMKAFKRGKELERQAAALEISLRKNRKKALSSGAVDDTQDIKDHFRAATEKITPSLGKKSKEKEDLSAELRELGWSDLDLHEGEKKPSASTVEGELSSLVQEVFPEPYKPKPAITADRSLVLVHKKKALELKRAGNLSEAKEELKKAKVLERKIEEEELLGGADDSDDELSSLIRSMDAEPEKFNIGTDIDNISGLADDFDIDGNFEVTEEDMEDPDMASALKSLGWVEESIDIQVKASSVQSSERDFLNQKRADGREHETSVSHGGSYPAQKLPSRSKIMIQKDLIAVKKRALTLKREGRFDESEQELKKARVLEAELEEFSKASAHGRASSGTDMNISDEEVAEDDADQVTDQDMHDPTYLALLKNMGWEDEYATAQAQPSTSQKAAAPIVSNKNEVTSTGLTAHYAGDYLTPGKTKKEIQSDLLALKRKALTLRRQGETDSADEVLETARALELQLQELEKQTKQVPNKNVENQSKEPQLPDKVTVVKPEQMAPHGEISQTQQPELPSHPPDSSPNKNSLSQEILSHKRKAVALKREGKLSEAKEELRLAKLLEKQADVATSQVTSSDSDASGVRNKETSSPNPSSSHERVSNTDSLTSDVPRKEKVSPITSSRERFKVQQESLAHKRQALKLRREGKITEAEAELELAKSLESRLQELDSANSLDSSKGVDEVEDFLDPQLLSALQSIGFEDLGIAPHSKETDQSKDSTRSGGAGAKADTEAADLAERIKSEKLMAVNLKRAGKQTEALAALRRAKMYEKKLHSLDAR